MKYIIEMDTNNGDDKSDIDIVMSAHDYYVALTEWAEVLRRHTKYDDNIQTDWEQVREAFWQTLRDCDVDLD